MLPRLRRSAGLLFVLFAGHLSMVISGAVCTTPGMAAMSGSSSAQAAPMAEMADMADMAPSTMTAGSPAKTGTPGESASSDHAPCSSPSQGTCVTGIPCVTALGAAQMEGFASSGMSSASSAIALIVRLPATSGSAPDLPPPRA